MFAKARLNLNKSASVIYKEEKEVFINLTEVDINALSFSKKEHTIRSKDKN